MNVIYASNDVYAKYLGISMLSLCDHNQDLDTLDIYILSQDISPENGSLLKEISDRYQRTLYLIDASKFSDHIPFSFDTSGYNPITLSRLFLCSYLPDRVEQILYLDCDIIVNGSIRELENLSFFGELAAGVPELLMPAEKKAIIGLNKEDTYYNAGVLLANLKLWRQENLEKNFVEYYRAMHGCLLYNDQDIINHCCKGRIYPLSHTYNLSTNLFYFPRFFVRKLQPAYDTSSSARWKQILKHPAIIHYMGDERPWIKGNFNKYRSHYVYYQQQSPWKNEPFLEGQRLYMLCYHTLNILTRICPWFRILFTKLIGINKYKWFSKQ